MLDFGFYNMDCMDGMKQFPDAFFDLAIVDPPYGINIGHNTNGNITIVGGVEDHSGERIIHAYGHSRKALASQNFIMPLMIARHQRQNTLQSCKEYQKIKSSGAEISSWTTLEKHLASSSGIRAEGAWIRPIVK